MIEFVDINSSYIIIIVYLQHNSRLTIREKRTVKPPYRGKVSTVTEDTLVTNK